MCTFIISKNSLCWLWEKKKKPKYPGWNFALILFFLQHFNPRFLLFLLISSIACILSLCLFHFFSHSSLPKIWFKAKYIVLINLLILVGCLLFHHWSASVLSFVPSIVGYLRLVGSPISFSLDFVFAKHLISPKIHWCNLSLNFSSACSSRCIPLLQIWG